MVNMNMIVNNSDLVGYEAEKTASKAMQKKQALALLLEKWGVARGKRATKIGGLGFLAVSLAACNSDSDSTADADLAAQLAAANAAITALQTAQAATEAAQAAATATAAEAAVVAATPAALSVLTTAIDTVVPAATSDSLSAGLTGTTQTWQSLDSIDMGAGEDTIVAIITGDVTPSMSNVENINVSNSTATATVNLSASTGVTSVTSTSSSFLVTFSALDLGTTLNVANSAGTTGNTFNWTAAGVVGTTDAATLNVTNVTGGTNPITIAAGIESLTINSNGSVTNNFTLNTTNPATLTIAGPAGITLAGARGSSTTTVDASAATGAVTMTYNATVANSYVGSAGADALTLTGGTSAVSTVSTGAGNDTVTFTADLLGAAAATADILDGGDGTDTLVGGNAELIALTDTATSASTITNFETIRMDDAFTAVTLTTSSIQTTGITTVDLDASTTGAGTILMGAGTVNVSYGNLLGAALVVGDHAVAATSVTTDDVLNLSSSSTAAQNRGDQIAGQTLTANGYETVNINTTVLGATKVAQDIGAIGGTPDTGGTLTVNFTGGNIANIDGTVTANVINASGMTAQAAGTTTFDMTGQAAEALGTAATLTLTGSPGDDVLLGDTGEVNTISGGAGADTITGGSGNDTITGGAGNDTLDGNDGNTDSISGGDGDDGITGGTGNDTITGGAGNDTINAENGANDNVDGGAGNDTVTISATANLVVGDVYVGGEGTDTVSFTAQIADSAATFSKFSGFEVFNAAPAATDTFTMSNFTNNSFTTVTLGDVGNAALVIDNAPDTLTDLTIVAGSAGDTYTVNRLVDGTANTVNITHSATGTISITDLNIANEEIVTVNAGALATDDVTYTNLDLADATSLTISGKGDFIVSNAHTGTLLTTMDASASEGAITINSSNSTGAVTATAGSGVLTFIGGIRADTINGGAAVDVLTGGTGNDIINGNAGSDTTLDGGIGDDTINGGAGDDVLTGGTGVDTMTGGSGADNFTTASDTTGITVITADIITDFSTTENDQIDSVHTAGEAILFDGSATVDFAAAVTAASTSFAVGGTLDNVYVQYNAFGTGDAYVFVDSDDGGTFAAGDDLIILKGINLVAEIVVADFI